MCSGGMVAAGCYARVVVKVTFWNGGCDVRMYSNVSGLGKKWDAM